MATPAEAAASSSGTDVTPTSAQLPRSLLPLALLFLAGFLPFLFYSSPPPLPLSHEVFSLEAFTV